MLEAWLAEQGLHCSINVGRYGEAGEVTEDRAWRVLLADITRHIAAAMHDRYGDDATQMIDGIVGNYLKELQYPTSKVDGSFQ